jgi:uncharacterized membrane protein
VADDEREQAQHQARREAVPFVLTAAAVLIALAVVSGWRSWKLIDHDLWWVWLVLAVPEFLLAAAVFGGFGRIGDAERRKRMAERLIGIVVIGSVVDLSLLLVTLVAYGTSVTGAQLLFSAFALLLTNVVAFGLAFWELDSGGPVLRALAGRRERPDFQFPQDENAELAAPSWRPQLFDYAYVSLTNSVAFSPTDVMPLTRPAKALMATESLLSFVTVLVVGARAINIIGS